MAQYLYKPLNKGEIRVLELYPSVDYQRLSGSITHIPLTNPIYHAATADREAYLEYPYPYEAISYTWGTDTRTPYSLVVDDECTIALTAHLHYVLQKIVQPDTSVFIWIDAICINQADRDSEEKAQQIRLMPDIYRTAKRVQIHLGPEADDSPLAIRLLEHVAEFADYLDESLNYSNARAYTLAMEKGFSPPERDDKSWNALRSFWLRPWFRRVWVFQELVLATDVVIRCGDLEIDWRKLWLAARVFQSNPRLIETGLTMFTFYISIDVLEGVSSFFKMADTRLRAWGYMSSAYMVMSWDLAKTAPAGELSKNGSRPHEKLPLRRDLKALEDFERFMKPNFLKDRAAGNASSFERRDLLTVLHKTRTFLATNPVDRIYAVLGLANNIDVDDPDFRIEYSAPQTPAVVCRRFATGLIKRGQGAAILGIAGSYAQARQPGSDFPSWVPDWTMPIRPNDLVASMNVMMHGAIVPDDKDIRDELLYCAAGNSVMDARLMDEDRSLIVRGALLDDLAYILKGQLFAPPHVYLEVLSRFAGQEANIELIEGALWRTLIANMTSKGEEAPPEYAAQYLIYKQRTGFAFALSLMLMAVSFLVSLPFVIFIIKMVPVTYFVLIFTVIYFTGCDTSPFATIAATILLRNSSIPVVLIGCGVLAYRTKELVLNLVTKIDYKWQYFAGFVMSFSLTPNTSRQHNRIPECADFMESFLLLAGKYNLGVTVNGFLGLFPLAAKMGDQVILLEGGYAPFVLRKEEEGDGFRLVGEAFVHNAMKGELWEIAKPHLQDIRLV